MELNDKITNFFNEEIYKWVAKNFGTQEAEDPSWNIEALSAHLSSRLLRKVRKDASMVKYEMTLVLNPTKDANAILNGIEQKVKEYECDILKKNHEGIKTLPYGLKGFMHADMSHWEMLIPKETVETISAYLNTLHEDVLRYLIVRVNERSK